MTVITAVRKGATAAIAADSQFSQGGIRIPGDVRSYPKKIQKIADAYVGVAGTSAHLSVLRSLALSKPKLFDFSGPDGIFETFRKLHPILREKYYLMTKEDDEEQEYESNQMSGLILCPAGIFSFHGYREISEYHAFWAAGSGMEVALGALEVLYPSKRSVKQIATEAAAAACKFDTTCGPPIECVEIELAT